MTESPRSNSIYDAYEYGVFSNSDAEHSTKTFEHVSICQFTSGV